MGSNNVTSFNQALHVQIADNIKTFRNQRELTLNALAAMTGIGKSTLSNLERGKGNPTIETIWRLAEVLHVGYGDLVGTAPPQASTAKGVAVELLHREAGERKIETFLLTLDRDAQRQAEAHATGVTEHVLVVRGALTLQTTTRTICLHAAEAATLRTDCEHCYQGGEDGAHVIVSVIYPGVQAGFADDDALWLDWPHTEHVWMAVVERVARLRLEMQHGMPHARLRFRGCELTRAAAEVELARRLGSKAQDGPGVRIRFCGHEAPEIIILAAAGAHERIPAVSYPQPLAQAVTLANQMASCGAVDAQDYLARMRALDQPDALSSTVAADIAAARAGEASALRSTGDALAVAAGIGDVDTAPVAASAATYDEFILLRPGYGRQCIEAAAHLQRVDAAHGDGVLAVHAGNGRTLAMVDELDGNTALHALESEPAAYAQLEARFADSARVTTQCLPMTQVPQATRYANVIAVGATHAPDAANFLRAVHACLHAGGTLFVSADMIAPFDSKQTWQANVLAHHLRYIHDTLAPFVVPTACADEAELARLLQQNIPVLLHEALNGADIAPQVRQLWQQVQALDVPARAANRQLAFYRFHVLELATLVATLDQDMTQRTSPACFVDLAAEIGFELEAHRRIYATHERSSWGAGTHIFILNAL